MAVTIQKNINWSFNKFFNIKAVLTRQPFLLQKLLQMFRRYFFKLLFEINNLHFQSSLHLQLLKILVISMKKILLVLVCTFFIVNLNAQNPIYYLLIGTYTDGGANDGIYVYRFNPK
jgi:hypothetical protein